MIFPPHESWLDFGQSIASSAVRNREHWIVFDDIVIVVALERVPCGPSLPKIRQRLWQSTNNAIRSDQYSEGQRSLAMRSAGGR